MSDQDERFPLLSSLLEVRIRVSHYYTGMGGGQDSVDPIQHSEGGGQDRGDPVQHREVRTGVTQYREERRSG